ncbi:MAG: hypothetical protein ACRD0Z_06060 [Acidimicrobiales bacterium]
MAQSPPGDRWEEPNRPAEPTRPAEPADRAEPTRPAEPAGRAEPAGPGIRNDAPKVPDLFGKTIPPTPRGWTDEEWRRSFLGAGRNLRSAPLLRSGSGWLLPLILGLVVLVLVVVLVLER